MTENGNKSPAVLTVEGLRKTYGTKVAIDKLSLTVYRGEIFGLIGANGAGKTSTIECLLGTRSRDAGDIRLLDMDPTRDRKRLFARVGVQFQDSRFQDKITVREACRCAAVLYPKTRDWQPLLADFGLAGKEGSAVQALSGGERQKLALVLALLPDPELVFLDEASSGLDPAARRVVWQQLKKLQAAGTSIVLSSHYMDEVEYLCDRVAILSQGRLVREGRPADLVAASSGAASLEDVFLASLAQDEIRDYQNNTMEASA